MGKIALIAPFPKLAELGEEVCNEFNEQLDIRIGDMEEGVKEALDAIDNGAQAIISRGGTAIAIREAVKVPVIEIAVTGYDLMRAINNAMRFSASIGVVGYKNIIYGVGTLRDILKIDLKEFLIGSDKDVDDVIIRMNDEEIKMVVGDTIAVRKASQNGFFTVLVHSGKEAIIQAIREAYNTIEMVNRERERTEEIRTLINFVHDGIITLDALGKVKYINPIAERILNTNAEEIIGHYANDMLPGLLTDDIFKTSKPLLGEVSYVSSGLIVKDIIPVISKKKLVGVIITIQEAHKIQKAEEKVRRELYLKGNSARYTFDDMKTVNEKMKELSENAKKFAIVNSTILISGETGTGKEVLAQSIHNYSLRREEPFVAINCAAVPESLLESELFGYNEGAFTGAKKGGKPGLFEMAHQGTLFLDEIGEMPLKLQARLLRVLQEKVVRRIGDDRVIPLDVRIISATNKNLLEEVNNGKFREDLYYRLNVLSLHLPPLRERTEDIPYLIEVFINKSVRKTGCKMVGIENSAINELKKYSWPGNIRELENVIERLVVLKNGAIVTVNDLYGLYEKHIVREVHDEGKNEVTTLDIAERKAILKVLDNNGWSIKKTAKELNISRTTLWRKMNKYGFNKET